MNDNDTLLRVTALSDLLRRQLEAVDALSAQLAAAKEAARRTEREDLPMLMQEIGVSEITLEDGTRVTVADDVEAGVSAERMPAAIKWLKDNGYDGIVRVELKAEFARGEMAEAEAAARELHEVSGKDVNIISTIHNQTLKAFVRERLAAGDKIPFDVFGIQPFSRAKLKAARASGRGR